MSVIVNPLIDATHNPSSLSVYLRISKKPRYLQYMYVRGNFEKKDVNILPRAVGQLPLTIFWPIFPFALILGVILLWLFVDLNLRSIASSEGFTFPNASTRPAGRMSREWMQWAITNAVKCDPTVSHHRAVLIAHTTRFL